MSAVPPTVVLVGLMGTGKSTVAWDLSRHYGVALLDTDKLVEQRAGRTVREIFADDGEARFRRLESEVLLECLRTPGGAVVAAAGGVVLDAGNRAAINEHRAAGGTVVVWLTAPAEVLAERTAKGSHRPLLDQDRLGTLEEMSRQRGPLYREVSDVVVDVSHRPVESVAELIVQSIEALVSVDDDRVGGENEVGGTDQDRSEVER